MFLKLTGFSPAEDDDAFFESFPGDDLGPLRSARRGAWRPAWRTRAEDDEDDACVVPTTERLNRLVDAYAAAPRALKR